MDNCLEYFAVCVHKLKSRFMMVAVLNLFNNNVSQTTRFDSDYQSLAQYLKILPTAR